VTDQPLLPADVLARTEALGLRARAIVEGLRVGEHRSPYRGFAVEFAQHREYAPGDDVRRLDWKVLARTDRLTVKQHNQETNFVGHIVLDGSRSMLYGRGEQNKLEYAKLLAASLACIILGQRDSVGLWVFDEGWRQPTPPGGQAGQLHTLLQALAAISASGRTRIGPVLHDLADGLRHPGLVFLISDLLEEQTDLPIALRRLRHGGHEVIVFHVLHADELELPFDGLVRFEGMENEGPFQTEPAQIRVAYRAAAQQFVRDLQTACEESRCDYVLLNTARPLADSLAEYLARRRRVRRI